MLGQLEPVQISARMLRAIAGAAALACASAGVQAQTVKDVYAEFEQKMLLTTDAKGGGSLFGATPIKYASGPVVLGFEGPSQYDAASFGRNFIPPDTMGAVGSTQFMAALNGVYGVYDKATGSPLSVVSDVAFWAAAGKIGANGDSRVLFNSTANRWIALSFGNSVSDIQIAVSDSANALGAWKSTQFTGFAGGTADYPTLAFDKNAVYIGTNNFSAAGSFKGTTLNIIPVNSLFNAVAPTVTNMMQLLAPYPGTGVDLGYAIQGVMGNPSTTTGKIVSNSTYYFDNLSYNVTGLTASSATAAAATPTTYLGVTHLTDPGAARQPAALAANQRVIDALDQRIGSNVYESQGKIFSVQTIDGANLSGAADHARLRVTVINASTNAILSEMDLGTGAFDYFQGSLAVNAAGRLVVGYNRSGATSVDLNGDGLADGNVSFMAQSFWVDSAGALHAISGEILLKAGLTSDYHNGSIINQAAVGRQRWGDYSQVTIDPTDANSFWAIGEFAREYNNAAGGHLGGTGGSRWGTYVAEIQVAVPEPSTYAMLLLGLATVCAMGRRRRNPV